MTRPRTPGAGDTALRQDDTALSAAGTCLAGQLGVVERNRVAFLARDSHQALHDLRVGFNRFKEALRLFRPRLVSTSARNVSRNIAGIRRTLGPHRDLEVWQAFLGSPAVRKSKVGGKALKAQRRRVEEAVEHSAAEIHVVLEAPDYVRLNEGMQHLIHKEIPHAMVWETNTPCMTFLAQRLRSAMKRLTAGPPPGRHVASETLHEIRKGCKRVRYWAEFSTPILGSETGDLANRVKRLTRCLGNIQDLSVQAGRPELDALPELHPVMRRLRKQEYKLFLARWAELCDPDYQHHVNGALRAFETAES